MQTAHRSTAQGCLSYIPDLVDARDLQEEAACQRMLLRSSEGTCLGYRRHNFAGLKHGSRTLKTDLVAEGLICAIECSCTQHSRVLRG